MGRGSAGADGGEVWGGGVPLPNKGEAWGGGCASPLPRKILTFWLKIVHFGVYSTELKSVKYTLIHLFTFVIAGGGGYARPRWGTSRSINWGELII